MGYSIWDDIESHVAARTVVGYESKKAFKKRLRLTALRTSPKLIAGAMQGMQERMNAIIKAKGDAIPKD